ncbi:hypothetical protein J4422_02980 [Candidatus Pacearchaeota archaeon]|nr:hypothetical protein [Candidatus Pacearchaeota archaeon]
MVGIYYYLLALEYKEKLRPFLQSKGEEIHNPTICLISPYAEAFRLRTGESVAYGKGVFLIGARRTREVRGLESKLKRKGIKLTEIKNPKKTHEHV